jgi:hypothetical protein
LVLCLIKHYAMKTEGVSGGIAPPFFTSAVEVSGQLHASVALPPGKETSIPIGLEVMWAPQPVWTQWIGEKSFAPARNHSCYHSVQNLFVFMSAVQKPKN